MKIVATSDMHGQLPDTPECDVLIVAGDVAPDYGRPGGQDHHKLMHVVNSQKGWLTKRFVPWLESRPGDPLILGIAGNHDFALEKDEEFARALPWRYLLDESFNADGVWFYGLPWVPNLSAWAFHAPDFILDHKFNAIPEDTHIVISHGPPFGFCDRTVPRYGDVNAGCPCANEMISNVHPALFICGHIHEGRGWSMTANGTLVANVSHVDIDYEPVNEPVEFTFTGGTLGWSPQDYGRTPHPQNPRLDQPVGVEKFGWA